MHRHPHRVNPRFPRRISATDGNRPGSPPIGSSQPAHINGSIIKTHGPRRHHPHQVKIQAVKNELPPAPTTLCASPTSRPVTP